MLPVDRAVTDPARVDVPALLAEVRSLRAERDALRDQWSDLLIKQARLMVLRDDAVAERDALRKVDDAMVDRALYSFYYKATGMVSDGLARRQMRAALDAALVVQP